MSSIVGIDLGTTNSVLSIFEGGHAVVIANTEGSRTTPSVVAYTEKEGILVGEMARRQSLVNPKGTIYSIKRFMGKRYDEVPENDRKTVAYDTCDQLNGDLGVRIDGRIYSPSEISAQVLSKFKTQAEQYLGHPVDEAVITVPAYFNDAQRRATQVAGEIAGLKVRRIINEPTAAALAYGVDKDKDEKVAIYDFGGGTFDISVLEIDDGVYNVLATGGDTFLGGNDFNQAIAAWVIDRFKKKTKIDLSFHTLARQRIIDAAEFAKIQLSSQDVAQISLQNIVPDIDPRACIDETLSREQMESLCLPLVERSLRICRSVFDSAGLHCGEIDQIVMVGGMTKMPLIRRKVEEWFLRPPNTSINPDEAVGIGAAIQAMALDSDSDAVLLLDVIPLTLSIEAAGGVCIPLIPKNTKVPHRISRVFTTSRDNQQSVIISIFQGEGSHVADNTRLATFELAGIRPAKRMEPRIEVSLRIDVNGILSITAVDLDSKQSQSVQVVDMNVKAIEGLSALDG